MKCPSCDKVINVTSDELEHLIYCPFCSMRFSIDFDIIDFLDKNAALFSIFGIFTAIAVILPTFSQYSKEILINSTRSLTVFYTPPLNTQLEFLNILTKLFVLGCGMMILLIGTIIFTNLSGGNRYMELILWGSKDWGIRNGDPIRLMFMFPFFLLSLSLIFYIAIISGDFFQYYFITFAIFFAIIFFLIYRGSPSLFKK